MKINDSHMHLFSKNKTQRRTEMNYNDLSRKSLIRLAKDFDAKSGNGLKEYFLDNIEYYEKARPIEILIDKMDDLTEVVKEGRKAVSSMASDDANKIIDSVTKSVNEFVNSISIRAPK